MKAEWIVEDPSSGADRENGDQTEEKTGEQPTEERRGISEAGEQADEKDEKEKTTSDNDADDIRNWQGVEGRGLAK